MVLPSFSAALLASARATAAHHSRRPLTTTHLLRSYGRSLISTRSALYGRPRAAASSSSSSFASPLWGLHDPSGRFFSTQGTGKAKTEEEIEDEYEQELDREDDAHTKTEEGEKEFEEQQIKEQGWKEVWIPRLATWGPPVLAGGIGVWGISRSVVYLTSTFLSINMSTVGWFGFFCG